MTYFDLSPKPVRKLRVGHDLDGCFYLFDRAWYNGAVELGWINPAEDPYVPAETWNFFERYGFDFTGFRQVCDAAADQGLLWSDAPMPGARDAWRSIALDDHEIHVITDRKFGSHPIASEVATRTFLHQNALRHDSVTFSADKTCLPVDVMIEDKLENYDALEECGVLVYLIDRPWNQDPGDHRRRIYSLDEWVTRVRALAARPAAEPAHV